MLLAISQKLSHYGFLVCHRLQNFYAGTAAEANTASEHLSAYGLCATILIAGSVSSGTLKYRRTSR